MFSKILNAFSQFFFPPFCEWCRILLSTSDPLCNQCIRFIQPVVSYKLSVTKQKIMWVHALGAYQDPLKYLILAKGWSHMLASKQLSELLWKYAGVSMLSFDLIVPIPLHWTRFSWRGYNQAEIMAQELAKKSNRQYFNILKRIRKTKFQSELLKSERAQNVRGIFLLNESKKELLLDKQILLVDDLMTTGATLSEAAKVLLQGKPKSITGLVACRVT